jgi:hypothetical protein
VAINPIVRPVIFVTRIPQHVTFFFACSLKPAFLLRVGGDRLPQNVLVLVLWGLAARSAACSSSACLSSSFTVSPNRSRILCLGLLPPSANALRASLHKWSSVRVRGRRGGPAVRWPWQILASIPRPSGSFSSADCDLRRQNVGLRNGPPRSEGFPHKSRLSGFRVAHRWSGLARL